MLTDEIIEVRQPAVLFSAQSTPSDGSTQEATSQNDMDIKRRISQTFKDIEAELEGLDKDIEQGRRLAAHRSATRRQWATLCCLLITPGVVVGPVSGAIGFSILGGTQAWTVPGLTIDKFVGAMTAGNAVMWLPTLASHGAAQILLEHHRVINTVTQRGIFAASGALSGLAGVAMFGLTTDEQLGFAAGAGVVGNAVLLAAMVIGANLTIAVCNAQCPKARVELLRYIGKSVGYDYDMPENTLEANANRPTLAA